jgi:hypothetical protein
VLQIMRDQWLADAQCTKIRELQGRIKRLEDAMSEIAYAASHPLGAGQSLTLGKIESIAIKAKEAKP